MPGIADLGIRDTPVSVIDFETTGLYPKSDRVIEITVVRIDPGQAPRVVFDSLVNPQRRVSATDIHGITDDDVRDAPTFAEIAGDLVDAIKGTVVSSYNVYFDLKFLLAELERLGVAVEPPHFCLMYMRPLLGIGKRSPLSEACQEVGIPISRTHTSHDDAFAAAQIFQSYLEVLDRKRIGKFGELSRMATYKFLSSFAYDPLTGPESYNLALNGRCFSRSGHITEAPLSQERIAIREYWDVIKQVIADLQVTDEEVDFAIEQRRALGLSKEQIRYLHARAFAAGISQFIDDQHVDDTEVRKLRKLRTALSRLGWAPGD